MKPRCRGEQFMSYFWPVGGSGRGPDHACIVVFFFFSFFFFPFLFCSEVGGVGACQECSVRLEEAGEKEKKKKNRSNQYKVALRRASLTLKTEGARPAATSST